MLAERLVGVVQDDLAFARVLDDGGLAVVAHGSLGHASEEPVHVHVAPQPGAFLHAGRRFEICLPAERQNAHKRVYLRYFAGRRVDQAPADRRPGPVHFAGDPGLVFDALCETVGDDVVTVPLAEPRVVHGDAATVPAFGLVLVVQQAQVDADSRHLLVDAVPVRFGERASMPVLVGVEQAVDLVFRHVLDPIPRYAALGGDVEHLADRAHRHMPRRRYRPP
ncbi:hypothetical protein [Paraeggerthella sp.]|uniref:hypothetical protein n=1 Tax=Paraeggerthella sp. TaxID=2897350 RepID=UPI0035278834